MKSLLPIEWSRQAGFAVSGPCSESAPPGWDWCGLQQPGRVRPLGCYIASLNAPWQTCIYDRSLCMRRRRDRGGRPLHTHTEWTCSAVFRREKGYAGQTHARTLARAHGRDSRLAWRGTRGQLRILGGAADRRRQCGRAPPPILRYDQYDGSRPAAEMMGGRRRPPSLPYRTRPDVRFAEQGCLSNFFLFEHFERVRRAAVDAILHASDCRLHTLA